MGTNPQESGFYRWEGWLYWRNEYSRKICRPQTRNRYGESIYVCSLLHNTAHFKDLNVMVEGPAATDLQNLVHESVQDLSPASPINTNYEETHEHHADGVPVMVGPIIFPFTSLCLASIQVIDSNALSNKKQIQTAVTILLNTATHNCYIITPYFLPPLWLKRALIRAAKRGVDVRIITAGERDVPAVRYASQHIYSAFFKYVPLYIF